VLVALSPRLARASRRALAGCCLAGALGAGLGYLAVARTQLNAFDLTMALGRGEAGVVLAEGAKLVVLCLALFAPFLAAGLVVAMAFASRPERVNRLYGADLLGAGLACAAAVPLLTALSPPGCVLLAGALLAAAGLRPAAVHPRLRVALAAVSAVLLVGVSLPDRLPDPVPDRMKTMSPQQRPQVRSSYWNPVFRVDVLDSVLTGDAGLVLSHDGMWGSVLPRFDGDLAGLGRYATDARAVPFALLGAAPRVLIIGAAGGNEILASLRFGASHVTAVELNPVTVSLLTTHFRDYTGRLAEHERVTLVNAEGRAFLGATRERWDLVWFVAPDSYAAMNAATSGAFVLSESYLYTVEMLEESLAHLTPQGVVCAQFGEIDFERKPNRTLRYLATAREALARRGVTDFARHALVATAAGVAFTNSTILIGASPFTAADVRRFEAAVAGVAGARVRFAWGDGNAEHALGRVITLPPAELERWHARHPFDVRPVTDDAPFFWHFVRFGAALRGAGAAPGAGLLIEEGTGERLLVVLLVVASLFGAVFLLVPLLADRARWRAVPGKGRAAVYFGALGLGFMSIEVVLIQRFTLFLGYPTYSLTVTMFALLVATGAGSLVSERLGADARRALLAAAAVLAALVAFHLVALAPLLAGGAGLPFALRVLVAVAVLAPLGLCLGTFMPLGLRLVARLGPDPGAYVAWAWAVNGFCSVVASVLATLLSMSWGFDAVLVTALGIYGVGIAVLAGPGAPGRA
jgi:hypothetical protein